MRFGITSKLFATILITNVMIAVVFGAAMQISVNRGFHEYVEGRELRRLQQLANVFAVAYARHRDWSFVQDDDEWRRLRGSDHAPRPRTDKTLSEADFISTKAHCLEIFQREVRKG